MPSRSICCLLSSSEDRRTLSPLSSGVSGAASTTAVGIAAPLVILTSDMSWPTSDGSSSKVGSGLAPTRIGSTDGVIKRLMLSPYWSASAGEREGVTLGRAYGLCASNCLMRSAIVGGVEGRDRPGTVAPKGSNSSSVVGRSLDAERSTLLQKGRS